MSNDRRLMLAVFALALGFRVLYPAIFADQTGLAAETMTPELEYASKIASGFEWISTPISPRSPGYPVFLAGLYLLAFKQLWLVVFFQAVLGALTVVLVYRMAVHLLGSTAGILVALWYALSISHIRAVGEFHRDILAVFLIILMAFLLTRPFQRMFYGIVSGVIYAILIHVAPVYLTLLPMFGVLILLKTKHPILNVQYLFLFAGTLIVFCVPWTLRNNAVYDQPIPIGLEAERFLRPTKIAEGETGSASELDGKVTQPSKTERIRRNVVEFWRFARFNDGTYVNPATGETSTWPAWSLRYNVASILTFGILLPFFVVGVIAAVRSRHRVALLYVFVVLYYFLVRAYFNGNVRTRMPADPFIIMLAFYGIMVLKTRFAPPRAEESR